MRKRIEFGPQDIDNILYIIAKKRHKTCLSPELERLAEAISEEFNPHAVANTLWAFATMKIKLG